MPEIRKIRGANMDIDLMSFANEITWTQETCPWNAREGTASHKCAVKSTSICTYFCGIEYLDIILCCYPNNNPYHDD